jgi:hypothetical protein
MFVLMFCFPPSLWDENYVYYYIFFSLSSFLSQSVQFTKIGAFAWLLPQGAYFGKAPPLPQGFRLHIIILHRC